MTRDEYAFGWYEGAGAGSRSDQPVLWRDDHVAGMASVPIAFNGAHPGLPVTVDVAATWHGVTYQSQNVLHTRAWRPAAATIRQWPTQTWGNADTQADTRGVTHADTWVATHTHGHTNTHANTRAHSHANTHASFFVRVMSLSA